MNPTLKSQYKSLCLQITTSRKELKEFQRAHSGWDGGFYAKIHGLSQEARCIHIARCLLRGTPYEAIEKPAEGNEPNMEKIKEIMHAQEAVHTCA